MTDGLGLTAFTFRLVDSVPCFPDRQVNIFEIIFAGISSYRTTMRVAIIVLVCTQIFTTKYYRRSTDKILQKQLSATVMKSLNFFT